MTISQSICNLCDIFCSPEIHKAMLNEMPFVIHTQVSKHHKHETVLKNMANAHVHAYLPTYSTKLPAF
jgi:imidazoleglycerol phosphate dehydratase HisB